MAIQNPYYPVAVSQPSVITLTAAATGSTSSTYLIGGAVGVQVYVNVTAITGTSPTLTVTIQGVDPTSGATFTVLASSAISATGLTVLTVYPGTTAAANVTANMPMPYKFQIATTIGGTTPAVTATVGFATLV